MSSRLQARAAKPLAKQFLKTDMAVALTTVWATEEEDLAQSVNRLHEALDMDNTTPERAPTKRAAGMREAAGAIMSGDLPEHYLAEYTPVENAERAVKYLGLSGEEWADAREAWITKYHDAGIEKPDHELVKAHIERQFGVDRETFEDLVVGWDDESTEAAMREILLGPLDDVRDAIDAATEELEPEP